MNINDIVVNKSTGVEYYVKGSVDGKDLKTRKWYGTIIGDTNNENIELPLGEYRLKSICIGEFTTKEEYELMKQGGDNIVI